MISPSFNGWYLGIPMLPKDRFSSLLSPLSQRTGLTKRLQFTQITGNYGKHQEPYVHGLFTAFSLTFQGLFTAFSHLSQ